MVTTKQQQQLDLADRIEKVQALIEEISIHWNWVEKIYWKKPAELVEDF